MLVGGRVALEAKNKKIVLMFDDQPDITLKNSGFYASCISKAESLISEDDIEAKAKAMLEKKLDAIKNSPGMNDEDKQKAVSDLETGESRKEFRTKANAILVHEKSHMLSAQMFTKAIKKLQNCFAEIANDCAAE